jgi:GTP-binding protein Era
LERALSTTPPESPTPASTPPGRPIAPSTSAETGPTRCGFITLVGRPNVGKSTLLNRMLGQKIAITSARPQTTRNRIPGVLTRDDSQMVFIDTPGIHRAGRALNRFMNDVATSAIGDTDAVALIVEAGLSADGDVGVSEVAREIIAETAKANKPAYLVINKIDRLQREQLLPVIDAWRTEHDFTEIIPVSALKGQNVDHLVDVFAKSLPNGPHMYPADALTDLPERFIAAEIIREKIFRTLKQEVPYSVAVTIESWRDLLQQSRCDINAIIHVERDSQKGIVIGKGGQMIKHIGIQARSELERLLDTQVNLSLFVRVDEGWTRSASSLRKMGYER